MLRASFRWLVASTAAVLLIGIVVAQWVIRVNPNPEVDPVLVEKFVAGDGLVDDGRIGKVTDAQGVVAVKPVQRERWSPVQPQLVLKPGDWLRTDSRGANAVTIKLIKSIVAYVGPHSLVELLKANEVRLIAGEIELTGTAEDPVELRGPDQQTVMIKDKQHYRIDKDKLVRVEQEPLWLKAYKGTTANESIGSLIATVDGRDVPLTVGFHHVTVDIRDQIARTVIEESFVNRSNFVLEGVFYFPLPADASISGFGMWIGDQLVEADVVEKQRAREIYETILREKRDPGLLEWAGGNIFKARVFPIPGLSEKRIKISYTQVLPRQGNRYRYSYALQSEMLKQTPLRDLKIDLTVNSAAMVKAVSSPTHPARIAKTEHSGHVEFAAQEYTPSRDFEAVIEVEGNANDVVVIPHRRGDDGYFMVQLTPPGSGGGWERPLVPNGNPLKLLLLADTSASMDKGLRTKQNAVIAGLLGALTPKDSVNIATCDVNCDWVFEKPVAVTPENLASINQALIQRTSLGWTDLDKAFASAIAMCEPGTHVVYLGDGIITTGDADPVAFSKRLARLYQGKGTFHAVAIGSSFEAAAMKAIASLGGGSLRRVTGERGPQVAALELLTEIASPTLRDLKVEFTGLQTARVYPEVIPNIAAGTQQILLGRYLPEGKDQSGEIVVTGKLGSKPVRFTSKISLKDAEQGNSFIPRLWARMHLDKLLEQGTSETVKQDVIALSEEFNIITPYTSLLVLESDADRERFAVKRRFQMRDGERFFADGRDNATYDLKQKQMKQAGDYRTALRRSVLANLASLGRNAQLFQNRDHVYNRRGNFGGGGAGGKGGELYFGSTQYESESLGDINGVMLPELNAPLSRSDFVEFDGKKEMAKQKMEIADKSLREMGYDSVDAPAEPQGMIMGFEPNYFGKDRAAGLGRAYDEDSLLRLEDSLGGEFNGRYLSSMAAGKPYYRGTTAANPLQWLGPLFPNIAASPTPVTEIKSTWPDSAIALSRSLLRTEKLAALQGGLALTRQTDRFDGRRDELSYRQRRIELVSPTAWFTRTNPDGGAVTVTWCDAKEYGTYVTAFQLGRWRTATALDVQQPPLELADPSMSLMHQYYSGYSASVEVLDKDRTLLILVSLNDTKLQVRFLIDTTKHVVISIEHRYKDKVNAATKFSDFVEVAGMWWAERTETFNDQNERLSLATQKVAELSADGFTKRLTTELAGKAKVLFLRQPLPTVDAAKAAVKAGKATFDDQAVLAMHFATTQQWSRAREHVEACERLSAGKTGMRWLVNAFLLAGRKHEVLRKRLLEDATTFASTIDEDLLANDYFLAEHLIGQAQQVLATGEMMTVSDLLQKVYTRQPVHLQALKTWQNRRVSLLVQAGQADQALVYCKQLADEYPRDSYMQYQYAQTLATSGDYEAAYRWLTRSLEAKWTLAEETSLRGLFTQLLQQQQRYRELADYLAEWLKRDADSESRHSEYLAALIRTHRAKDAETLAEQWLQASQVGGKLTHTATVRRDAAIAFMLGNGPFHRNRIDERWHKLLAEAALYHARRDDGLATANTILQDYRFSGTEAALEVRKQLDLILKADIDTMPVGKLDYYLNWVTALSSDDWTKIAASLRKRWETEPKADAKHRLAQPLQNVLNRLGTQETLAFLRVQLTHGPAEYRALYANQLFNALLGQPWTTANEDECFALLDKLVEADNATGLQTRVAALYRLTNTMLEARYQARMKTVDRPDKLTRTDLQKKQDENRKLAREGYAERLRTERLKHAKPFASWLLVERLWLEMLLDRDLKTVAIECWTILDTPAVKAKPDDDATAVALETFLRDRVLVMLQNLATRKGAEPALIERLLKFIDRQIVDGHGRDQKYRLLIALDRSADLEKDLRDWLTAGEPESRWRLALGYLLAEQGKVAEAIAQFELVEAADELSPAAYRSLADWYLVENKRDKNEAARIAVYKTAEEYQLVQLIASHLRPWQNTGHAPLKFDPEVLLIFKVLFDKSAAPQNYLSYVQQFYQASHDFRLLAMLPDGVIGHTAGKVYPFLSGMTSVLSEVRDEATADELVARLAQVRPLAKSAVDQRALDLLELLVERRSAELKNQPGPHADKALTAMKRAFEREWSIGEPRLMADFLAGLGRIAAPPLAAEQLRELEVLHRDAKVGTFDRLHIAHRTAETLNACTRSTEATDLLHAALKEFEAANGGKLPTTANPALETLITFIETAMHYERGEKLLLAQLTHPVHTEQKNWLIQRINKVYQLALMYNGDVSLGKGAVLYKALEKKLYTDLDTTDANHRYQILQSFTGVYRTAHDRKIVDVKVDLKSFVFQRLPVFLKEQFNNYDGLVREVSDTVRHILGAKDGIAFLLDCAESEPDWRRYSNQDVWTHYVYQLGSWRREVQALGDVEPRLLKFVLAELRRDLSNRESRQRVMYDIRSVFHWDEKVAEFAKVAEEVLAARKASSGSVEYIAEYVFFGLPNAKRAIEMLFAAHGQKILAESGQWQLIDYLHRESRFAESIPLLLPLVEIHPDNLSYRTKLMHAYFRTDNAADLLALLKATDAYFHEKDRWSEGPMAALAYSCLENHLFAPSAAYYEELIPLHQRSQPRRGIGNGTLSGYYAHAAQAYSGLGKTKLAVDMASGAVVSWGPTHHQRADALANLVNVLAAAPDLAAYAKELDKEKLQSAVIRKAIGKAFVQKHEEARAIPHLLLAAELQPDDAETYVVLLACYDKVGDKAGAVRQLFSAVDSSRRDIALFEQLGRRLAELKQSGESERAYTSLVEMLPNESESHAMLAEAREKQDRWQDAAVHWERVARIRSLEPTGLQRLAAAQIHLKEWDSAKATVQKLRSQTWPPRFGDIPQSARELEKRIEERAK